MRARSRAPLRVFAGAAAPVALLLLCVWILGLWPSFGAAGARLGAASTAPVWVTRLGITDLNPGASPNPLVEDRLGALEGTPTGERLRDDLCTGRDMQPDRAFREVRRALVANNAALCPAPVQAIEAKAPLIVALGPEAGWPATLGLVAALLALAAWRALAVKRGYDRWRLLDRSTFGSTREPGRG